MTKNLFNFEQVSHNVIEVAKLAGAAVSAIYDTLPVTGSGEVLTHHKDDKSPVTTADLAAHQIIFQALGSITPDIPVVSEEDPASLINRRADTTFWLIDPLDGTKEFLSRHGEFTINIALIVGGQAVWGVVNAPALGATYWGGSNFGASKDINGKTHPIRVSVSTRRPLRVVASKSHLNQETQHYIESLGSVELIQAGSSLKFCRIAEGLADLYPRLAPTSEWDTAAAQAVLEGAGGFVYDLSGRSLQYGKMELLNPSFIAFSTAPKETATEMDVGTRP